MMIGIKPKPKIENQEHKKIKLNDLKKSMAICEISGTKSSECRDKLKNLGIEIEDD